MPTMKPRPVNVVFFGKIVFRSVHVVSCVVVFVAGVMVWIDVRWIFANGEWNVSAGVGRTRVGRVVFNLFFRLRLDWCVFECLEEFGVFIIQLVIVPTRWDCFWQWLDVTTAFAFELVAQSFELARRQDCDSDTVRSKPTGSTDSVHVRSPTRWDVEIDD
jgi:hypothetical protein